jgi:hypothetical protein
MPSPSIGLEPPSGISIMMWIFLDFKAQAINAVSSSPSLSYYEFLRLKTFLSSITELYEMASFKSIVMTAP